MTINQNDPIELKVPLLVHSGMFHYAQPAGEDYWLVVPKEGDEPRYLSDAEMESFIDEIIASDGE